MSVRFCALNTLKVMYSIFIMPVSLLLTGCLSPQPSINFGDLKTYSAEGHLQMVVEIPAGTNKKVEYDYETNTFPTDVKNGAERVIDFLPYPGNYGFVPSTMMELARGGDGDAIDVLLLSESLPTGTIIKVLPIGILELQDSGETDSKIIVVPFDKSLRVLKIKNFEELNTEFSDIKTLIRLWFLGYKRSNAVKFTAWGDEIKAKAEIDKWRLK